MVEWNVALFGGLAVCIQGQPAERFESNYVRALFAYILLERDRAHSREALTCLLWPDQPQATASHRLRQVLTNLRQALDGGDGQSPLVVTRNAVGLDPSARLTLDVTQFSAMQRSCHGHQHRHQDACRGCLERLEAAVALYRGPLLAGLSLGASPAFDRWLDARRERFHQQAIEALSCLTDHYARQASFERALQLAYRQLALEPWREEAFRQTMDLLARSGQRTAALQQFATCRRVLREELGVEPAAETRELYRRIRSGALGKSTAASAPRNNLPQLLTRCIGRARDIAGIQDLLATERLVTVTGLPGCGKTRVALQAALEAADSFPDGVWLVDLARLSDPADVVEALAAVFELPARPLRRPLDRLAEHLRGKQLLLVFDTCEHLVSACAEVVDNLARRCPELCILATSREMMRVPGEIVWQVEPLGLPTRYLLEGAPDVVARDRLLTPAVELFIAQVRRLRPEFEPSLEQLRLIGQICHRLDGLPLAIELAARLVPAQGIEGLHERLTDSLRALSIGQRTAPSRHQSLRALIGWSFQLLTPAEQMLLTRLAASGSSWTLESVETIVARPPRQTTVREGDLADVDMLGLLTRLAEQSMLIVEAPTGGKTRFRLPETVRQYARSQGQADSQGCAS